MKLILICLLFSVFVFADGYLDLRIEQLEQLQLNFEENLLLFEKNDFKRFKTERLLKETKKELKSLYEKKYWNNNNLKEYNYNIQRAGIKLKHSAYLQYVGIGLTMVGTIFVLNNSNSKIGVGLNIIGLIVTFIAPSQLLMAGEYLEEIQGLKVKK